jgi:hypothetical protein
MGAPTFRVGKTPKATGSAGGFFTFVGLISFIGFGWFLAES